jgi:hypothetical protein
MNKIRYFIFLETVGDSRPLLIDIIEGDRDLKKYEIRTYKEN